MAYGDAFQITAYGRPALANFVELRAEPFTSENTTWVNIAKCGHWEGYKDGPIDFTGSIFGSMVANAKKLSTRPNFDYEHQTFNQMSVGPKPSAGVVRDLQVRGDELWALTAFTPRAADMIRSGEYRGCSVVVDFEHTDRVTGKEVGPALLSVALTNDPFIDGLHPIQLSRSAAAMSAPAPVADDKKPDDKPTEPVKATAEPDPAAMSADAPPPAADSAAASSDSNADALVGSLADATGQSKDAVLAILSDNIDALTALVNDNAGDGTASSGSKPMTATAAANKTNVIELKLANKRIAALEAQAAADRKEKAEIKALSQKAIVEEKVKALVVSGFVEDGDDAFGDAVHMFTADPARAARVYARKVVPIGGTVAGDDPNATNASVEPVTLEHMSETEKNTVTMLTHLCGEADAKQIVAMTRGGKMTPTEAKRELDAKKKKEAR